MLLVNFQCSIHTVSESHPKNIASIARNQKIFYRQYVSQFNTPFPMLSNLLDFSDRLSLNWSKLVWHWSSFSFLMTCLAILIWVFSTIYSLFWFLIRRVSWVVSFPELLYSTSACSWKIWIASPTKRVGKGRSFRLVSLQLCVHQIFQV